MNISLAFASSDSKHDRELESLCFCLQATFNTTDSCVTACCDLTNFSLSQQKTCPQQNTLQETQRVSIFQQPESSIFLAIIINLETMPLA